MEALLKFIHFKMFETSEREKRLRNNHTFGSEKERIRNDQSIIECEVISKILEEVEEQILRKLSSR